MQQYYAVDVGFGNVKGITNGKYCIFPAVIGDFSPVSFTLGKQDQQDPLSYTAIEYNYKRYFVGEAALKQSDGRNTIDRDRTILEEGMVLLATALSVLSQKRFEDIKLVVGLPEMHYSSMKDEYRNVAEGIHEINLLNFSGEIIRNLSYNVKEVAVIPQPMGTYFDYFLDNDGNFNNDRKKYAVGNIGIIDIGFNTLDLSRIDALDPIGKRSTSYPLGMFGAFQELSNEIYQAFGVEIPPEELEPFVQRKEIFVFGQRKPIHEQMKTAFTTHCEKILSRIKSFWPDRWELTKTLITGGGSIYLGDYLKEEFKGVAEVVPNPIFANVNGYLKYAKRLWG